MKLSQFKTIMKQLGVKDDEVDELIESEDLECRNLKISDMDRFLAGRSPGEVPELEKWAKDHGQLCALMEHASIRLHADGEGITACSEMIVTKHSWEQVITSYEWRETIEDEAKGCIAHPQDYEVLVNEIDSIIEAIKRATRYDHLKKMASRPHPPENEGPA